MQAFGGGEGGIVGRSEWVKAKGKKSQCENRVDMHKKGDQLNCGVN